MIHVAPGDPARMMLPMEATEDDVSKMREALGLDKPLIVQYLLWLQEAATLNFGYSIRGKMPAAKNFLQRLPATLELTFFSISLAVIFAIPIGIFAAIKKDSIWDFFVSFMSLFGLSTPRFWLGIILVLIFSLKLGWLPSFGRGPGLFSSILAAFNGDFNFLFLSLKHLALPSITTATWFFAIFLRYTRSSVLEELNKLYVKMARQKGINEGRVLVMHVLRNALIPIVTVIGLQIGVLMGGAVVIEIVFAWPGVGQLLVQSLFARDYPVIQACLFMIGIVIVCIFIVLDLIYVILDPRVSFRED
jgi:peptide/nickel transport system permease protein